MIEATDFKTVYGTGATFDGQTIDTTAVLVKYTYYGDTDFNGVVNFDDYSRTDTGFNGNRSPAGSTATSTATAWSTSTTTR